MADNTINVRIKDRSDTEANWTSKNPVLLKGERAITDGTGKYKIGDGKNTWSALPYYEAMTSADRTKLNGIASGANKTTVDSSLSSSSTNPVQNKVVNSALANHTHDLSTMINTLSIGGSTPTDEDYFISQYVGGGTTTATYHRRPVKALLEYIKKGLAKVATSGSYNDLSNKPTIPSVGNGTITIKQAGAVKGSFTTNQSGATTIELTDNNTNTWRGIQDNLTSSSTTDSLSAAQGKVLNDKFASYVPASRTVNGKALSANISLNASDVGASASGHTHNYAGSSSAGGSANSAVKLDTTTSGSATQPVYFSGGKPVAGTYTLGNACSKTTRTLKTVGNSGWKDASTDSNYVPDMSFIAYWNGAYCSSGDSNLAYCNKGAFGTAAVKNTDYFATAGHTHTAINNGITICGRTQNSGDDEGLVINKCSNNYAGLILGSPNGVRSVFYLTSNNNALWRYNNGSSSFDITHPKKNGTVALTSDIPSKLPASDVYAWAKASTKPSYSWGEISGKPVVFSPSAHSHVVCQSTEPSGQNNGDLWFKEE